MSSRFVIEMPASKASPEKFFLVLAGLLFMIGPVFAVFGFVGDSTIPFALVVVLVSSLLFGIACGALFIKRELSRIKHENAEEHLKSAVKTLGYAVLEPIEINGGVDRVLLRDEQGSALWNVEVAHDKVICSKLQ
jgi:hypothetical protein